ncbi:MAG: hypothetical protein WCK96_12165 [Methylococcales bacterium]
MNVYLVNSNTSNSTHCFEYMIRHNKVAAYFDDGNKQNWNKQIDPLKTGDLVLLYHNDNRIIAVGFVVKGFDPHDYQQDMGDVEHWADVNWIWKAIFDDQLNPVNSIIRTNELKIPMVNGTVIPIKDLNYRLLMEEIGKRQVYM